MKILRVVLLVATVLWAANGSVCLAVVRPPSFDRDIAADGQSDDGIKQKKQRLLEIVSELKNDLVTLQTRLQAIQIELDKAGDSQ